VTGLLRFSYGVPTADIVARILRTAFPDARNAIDLTPGRGNFWRDETPLQVEFSLDDFTNLMLPDACTDVALLDPPHNADAGADSIMGRRYGTYTQHELEPTVRAGAREAMRIARLGCIVKVTDHVHGQKFVRMSGWVFSELGEPYEVVHQVRKRALVDPRWRAQLSARNNGSSYLIYRRGDQRHVRREPSSCPV
jgi:hypothetical protein